jgi:hypothetical protein
MGSPEEAVAEGALLGIWKATGEGDEDFTITFRSSGDNGLHIVAESSDQEETATFQAFVLQNLENPGLYAGEGAEAWDWVLDRLKPGA